MNKICLKIASLILISGFLSINVYRAATQSITIDEANTYLAFVQPPLLQILTTYDANHHVLHSLLCKATTSLFGVSEFTLRLPSLAGGLLYCFCAFQICRLLLGDRWTSLLCLSVLILNPLTLDFSSLARGYSLGLGFLFLGVLGLLRQLRANSAKFSRWKLALCGVSLGLSISSVLTFVFPVAASVCVFAIPALRHAHDIYKQRIADVAALGGSAVVVAFIVNLGPLSQAAPGSFVIGFGSLFETLKNSLFPFLQNHPSEFVFFRWRIYPLIWLYPASRIAVFLILIMAAVLLGAQAVKRTRFLRSETCFLSALLIATIALLVAAHRCFGIPYPVARTAIYAGPLLVLAIAAMLRDLSTGSKLRFVWVPFGALEVLLFAQFIAQLDVTYYGHWPFDAGTRPIARFLATQPATPRPTRIIATWTLRSCLNFYREMYRLTEWAPVESPNGDTTLVSGDYVVFDGASAASMPHERFTSIFVDQLTGAVVATHR
ncbi:MAG TPA: glycosyltransferase family 39 protein [Bryobacteraceae bacterium]